MSRAHDLAWCAGFFDGEGYVTIQTRKSKLKGKEYVGYYLRIGVNHVSPKPLYELQRVFGGTIKQQKVTGNRHPRHSWNLSCNQAKTALIQLLPYLKNKNVVVGLALDFQDTMQTDKKQLSEEKQLYRLMLKNKISEENAKD